MTLTSAPGASASVRHGVSPVKPLSRNAAAPSAPHIDRAHAAQAAPRATSTPLVNHGGPVQTAPKLYVVYWDWTSDPSGERPYLERFLSTVGGTSWLGTVGQYGAGSGPYPSLLVNTWSDNDHPVPVAPSYADIANEAIRAITHFSLPAGSIDAQIVIATPTAHSSPGFGTAWCGFHEYNDATDIPFTYLPYVTDAGPACWQGSVNGSAGLLDGVSVVEGHELAESITDPLLSAWYADNTSIDEIGDLCVSARYGNLNTDAGRFAVQPLWSNATNSCVLTTPPTTNLTLATVTNTRAAYAKSGSLNGDWYIQHDQVTQVAVATDTTNGPLIAVLTTNGTVYAKQGNLFSPWVPEYAGATQVAVATDPVHGPLIAVVATDGTIYAKEGSLYAGWIGEWAGGTQVSVASDTHNGPLIAVLATNGDAYAKQGDLSASWHALGSSITQLSAASDSTHGMLLCVLNTSALASCEQGSFSAGWVPEYQGAVQVVAATDQHWNVLIGIVDTGRIAQVKQGSLYNGWVPEAGDVVQLSLAIDTASGPVIAVVDGKENINAKQGSLLAGWIYQNIGAQVSVAQ